MQHAWGRGERDERRRAITANAPFLEMTIGSGMIGDTIVATGGGTDVRVRVRTASWAKVEHLVIYANSAIVADQVIPPARATDSGRSSPQSCQR